MTIACLCHVRMTTVMVKTRTKVVETTGSQVVITEADKEMTVLTIINNLRKICACLFITDNLQENYVSWRQNDREKRRNNTDGQQNHRNNDRDDQSGMWSYPLHPIITIGDTKNEHCTVCNSLLHLIIYIGGMARGISRIPKRSKGRHAETVTTVGRWPWGSEGALRDIA